MSKGSRPRPEPSFSPFPVARQFTAPPFFMGLEDARLKSRLLLDAVEQSGKAPAAKPAKKAVVTTSRAKTVVKPRARKKTGR